MTEHKKDVLWCVVLSSIYLFSRIVYYAAGIRFDIGPLDYFFQYLDPVILRNNLWEGLLYLHSQPIVFNAFLGLVLKTGIEDFLFHALFILMGLGIVISVYGVAVFLGVSRILAGSALIVYIFNPSFIAYENHLFYTWPAAFLLSGGLFLLVAFLRSRGYFALFCYFVMLFLLCGIMSIYHLSYFIIILITLYIFLPIDRKALIGLSIVPFLLLVALYAKNHVIYGKFAASSWLGIALMDNFNTIIPNDHLLKLAERGDISTISLIKTFSTIDKYLPSPNECYRSEYMNISAIANERKSNGFVNYNHACYLYVSDTYLKDFQVLFKKYPDIYLTKIYYAWYSYFFPATDYDQLRDILGKISTLNDFYDRVVLGKMTLRNSTVYPGLLLGLPLSFAFALVLIVRRSILTKGQKLVMGLICLNVAYPALVVNTLTFGANNRIRFSIDPLYLILFCCLIQYTVAPMTVRLTTRSWRGKAT